MVEKIPQQLTPEAKAWLRAKTLSVMKWAPTKPPYSVDVASAKGDESCGFIIMGAACNALGKIFPSREIAGLVCDFCNEVAGVEPVMPKESDDA